MSPDLIRQIDVAPNCDKIYCTPYRRMVFHMLVVFAEYERKLIGERIKTSSHYKQANGEKIGGEVPFDYRARKGKLYAHCEDQKAVHLDLRGRGNRSGDMPHHRGRKHHAQERLADVAPADRRGYSEAWNIVKNRNGHRVRVGIFVLHRNARKGQGQ